MLIQVTTHALLPTQLDSAVLWVNCMYKVKPLMFNGVTNVRENSHNVNVLFQVCDVQFFVQLQTV